MRFLHQHHILGEAPEPQKVWHLKLLGEESPRSWHRPDESGAHVKPRWAMAVGPGLLWAPEMGKELKCWLGKVRDSEAGGGGWGTEDREAQHIPRA